MKTPSLAAVPTPKFTHAPLGCPHPGMFMQASKCFLCPAGKYALAILPRGWQQAVIKDKKEQDRAQRLGATAGEGRTQGQAPLLMDNIRAEQGARRFGEATSLRHPTFGGEKVARSSKAGAAGVGARVGASAGAAVERTKGASGTGPSSTPYYFTKRTHQRPGER
jgi:hypothetical protein